MEPIKFRLKKVEKHNTNADQDSSNNPVYKIVYNLFSAQKNNEEIGKALMGHPDIHSWDVFSSINNYIKVDDIKITSTANQADKSTSGFLGMTFTFTYYSRPFTVLGQDIKAVDNKTLLIAYFDVETSEAAILEFHPLNNKGISLEILPPLHN